MKGIGKYIIIALIAFAVGVFASSNWFSSKGETKIERDTIYITKVDSTGFNLLDKSKVDIKPVVLTIPKIQTEILTVVMKDSIRVSTTRYKGTQKMDNGIIDWTVYADNLYGTEFKLFTKDKVITNTITQTAPSPSRLYIMGGTDLNWVNKLPQGGELGLMYNHRQKWGVGASVRHDFSGLLPPENATTFGVKVYIGL